MKKTQTLAKATLVLTAIIWGAGFVFTQAALDAGFSVIGSLLGKFGIAAIVTGIAFRKSIRANMSKRALAFGIPLGLSLVASFFAQTTGMAQSSPSNCALITAAYVVMVPFMWRIVFRKKPSPVAYIASVLCFAGVVTLSVNFAGGFHFGSGDLWTLLCAVLFAVQIVATEYLVREIDYKLLLFMQFAVSAVVALAAFLIFDRDFSAALTLKGGGSILYLGVLSTCVCYFMQTSAQRYVSSNAVSLILSMESLFGSVFSVLFGYDALSAKLLIGGGLIMLSVVLPETVELIRGKKSISGGENAVEIEN
ncbi:MAG: DMT family transporter [Oscillospiraceae bacterium]|nr:DMT family transporter [Oscillospiraceae bacterium]